ncbi:hypothetical protein A0H81_01612 [Grifola frondosa]|uniref:C2H2-type domain-containing protein n=1 Tax=Grifola frondosa TaxID=5627 RepID=A0A1C7MLW5_GRIFR|nr:hypothetical protein A0H81_01612 [Grifola frondosa]
MPVKLVLSDETLMVTRSDDNCYHFTQWMEVEPQETSIVTLKSNQVIHLKKTLSETSQIIDQDDSENLIADDNHVGNQNVTETSITENHRANEYSEAVAEISSSEENQIQGPVAAYTATQNGDSSSMTPITFYVRLHMTRSHQEANIHISASKLNDVINDCKVLEKLPQVSEQDYLQPIGGLAIYNGLRCHHCKMICGSTGFMKKHHLQLHHHLDMPTSWPACKMQHLNNGPDTRAWFEVHPSGHPATLSYEEAIIKKLYLDLEHSKVDHQSQNTREICPWLLTTKWHVHTEPYMTKELRELVAFPKKDEFPGLSNAVLHYLNAGLALLEGTDSLTLQKLNTEDPLKTGINNTPFHRLQQDDSIKSYGNLVTCLLAMLLRPKQQYQIPLPAILVTHIQKLQQAIDDRSDIEDHIHHVLIDLWMTRWNPSQDNSIPCPSHRFLALNSVQHDGGHADASHNTQPIAKLKFAIRVTFLCQIKKMSAT